MESDLRLAEQRITMLKKAEKEDDNGDYRVLKEQLLHKSELLDKVKQLLTRAAINEKTLRQRVRFYKVQWKIKLEKLSFFSLFSYFRYNN